MSDSPRVSADSPRTLRGLSPLNCCDDDDDDDDDDDAGGQKAQLTLEPPSERGLPWSATSLLGKFDIANNINAKIDDELITTAIMITMVTIMIIMITMN